MIEEQKENKGFFANKMCFLFMYVAGRTGWFGGRRDMGSSYGWEDSVYEHRQQQWREVHTGAVESNNDSRSMGSIGCKFRPNIVVHSKPQQRSCSWTCDNSQRCTFCRIGGSQWPHLCNGCQNRQYSMVIQHWRNRIRRRISRSRVHLSRKWLLHWPGKVPPYLDRWNFTLRFLQ